MEFLDYSTAYPELLGEIIMYFSQHKVEDGKLVSYQVSTFCDFYRDKYNCKDMPQPRIISKICDILVDAGKMTMISRSGLDNISGSYWCVIKNDLSNREDLVILLNKQLSYLVYGFKYIYEDYSNLVLPIEITFVDGTKSLGTCFLYKNGIATAKHCLEGAIKISILGISASFLKTASYEIHSDESMDLLYVRGEGLVGRTIIFSESALLLDDVMTLGFPIIAGFHNFLTAENATVASRFTASVGQIVSNAVQIWIKQKLFLISAKIKGGNSGGPVINKNGAVVGVSISLPKGDGNYDNLGYGTVIPVSFLDDLIGQKDNQVFDVSKIEFVEFVN